MTAMEYYSLLKDNCNAHTYPDRAMRMKQYMRNKFEFYGINSPLRKEIVRKLVHKNGYPSQEIMPEFLLLCWKDEYREMQYFAMDILGKRLKYIDENYGALFEKMILDKSWWDTVDWIASRGVGQVVFIQ